MKTLLTIMLTSVLTLILVGCIEDGIDTSPSAQPTFSTDTLFMGTVFTDQPTPTGSFVVYNRNDKIISIGRIAMSGGSSVFRLNVDGFSGESFENIEIRPNDSIYVFVEATFAPNGAPGLAEINETLDFTTNGVTRSVVIHADGMDVTRLRGEVIDSDTRFEADYPYQIFDSLVVRPGATLTLAPGTTFYFHDKAYCRIEGTLVSEGTAEQPVNMCGDRMGNVVGQVSFDLMASQWRGLEFAPESRGNRLSHTIVRNTVSGVFADSLSQISFLNCRLRNSAGYTLRARYADLMLIGTELAEAADGVVRLTGGNVTVNHCTIANYYLFAALRGASVQFDHYDVDSDDGSGMPLLQADFTNTIIYGNGVDLSVGDLSNTQIKLRNCLLKSSGNDDDNFIACLWDTDPLYCTVRSDYYFDYRLLPDSPALGKADPALTLPEAAKDFYGVDRLGSGAPNLGAYQAPGEERE